MHSDLNYHESMKAFRRLRLLFYLNKEWKNYYKGYLGLYKKYDLNTPAKEIEPAFNTLALFSTTSDSFHGHPEALSCEGSISRIQLQYIIIQKNHLKILAL